MTDPETPDTFKLSPDGFKLIHVTKEQFGGIAYIYLMGLPGDLDKFLNLMDKGTKFIRGKGVPGFQEPSVKHDERN